MHGHQPTSRNARGFTLVELMVVFIIIALLVSILVVTLGGAIESARRSRTTAQLQSIGSAIDAFETDFRFVPPLVTPQLEGAGRQGLVTPQTSGNPNDLDDNFQEVRYHSEYTLAVYLLGIGALNPDHPNDNGIAPGSTPLHDGVPGPGFKSPGPLKAWKVQPPSGSLRHEPQLTGRTYGPYLDLGTLESMLEFDTDRGLHKITDVWGNPIRYYSGWRASTVVGGHRQPTLDEIPLELRSSESILAQDSGAPLSDLLAFDDEIRTASYALLSAGASADDYVGTNPYTGEQNAGIAPFGDVLFDSSGDASLIPGTATAFVGLPTEKKQSFEKQVQSNLRYVK